MQLNTATQNKDAIEGLAKPIPSREAQRGNQEEPETEGGEHERAAARNGVKRSEPVASPPAVRVKIHPTADVSDKAKIGDGTSVWHQAQIRENAVLGERCNISKGVYIDFDVKIGSGVKLQNYVNVYHGVTIEDDVFVGPSATFTNDMYPRAAMWGDDRLVKTLVKKGASIGANSTIICGTTIGRYATVGAGSVVTKDVPDHTLVFGSPARIKGFVCECGFPVEKKEIKGMGMEGAVVMKCTKCGKEFEVAYDIYRQAKK